MTLDAGPDASRDGHFGWYRALDKQERRAFWSCKIGYGLDGMDTQMLSFVIPTLIALWDRHRRSRLHPHHDPARLRRRRLDRRDPLRPHRPGADPATDGALVRLLHLPLRPRAELRAVAGRTDPDGLRLRWRMDRRRGTHRRSDQGPRPRQGGRPGAVRLGHRLGPHRHPLLADVQPAATGRGLARAVHARPVAGAVRPGGTPAGQGTGDLPRGQATQPGRRQGQLLRDLRPRDAQHHPARLAADHRRARRLLRHHRLAADLPQDRTRADRARHQRLLGDGDPRLLRRLRGQCLPHRPDRAQEELRPVRRRLLHRGPALHPVAGEQRRHALARLPARLLRLGHLQRHGLVPHRTVPNPHPRLRPGLLLQRRARHRRAVPDADRHARPEARWAWGSAPSPRSPTAW